MNQNKFVLERIEKSLKERLPDLITDDWKYQLFGKLPESVKSGHIEKLFTPCKELISLGGKRWRPMLLVLASGLKNPEGKPAELSYELTPIVELVHTASLIHDDIEDSADTRRGKPCAHITYGTDTALNSASWLYFSAFASIENACKDNLQLKNILTKNLALELRRLHLGQSMDIEWHKDNSSLPSGDEYLAMTRLKTGTLASLAAKTGLLTAGASEEEVEKIGEYCADIGVAFQIHDDIINLTSGNKGKKRGDDIVEGKKSLPVLIHLSKNKEDFLPLMECFMQAKNEGINSTAVEKAISIISKEGAIEEAALIARDLKDNAIKKISENWKDSKAKDNIIELFDLM